LIKVFDGQNGRLAPEKTTQTRNAALREGKKLSPAANSGYFASTLRLCWRDAERPSDDKEISEVHADLTKNTRSRF